MINQEHHCNELAWADLCVGADEMGWKLAGSQAVTTARLGRSAGTAIASRSNVEAGLIAASADLSPPGSEGRLVRRVDKGRATHGNRNPFGVPLA